jgi:hypothetical protein
MSQAVTIDIFDVPANPIRARMNLLAGERILIEEK